MNHLFLSFVISATLFQQDLNLFPNDTTEPTSIKAEHKNTDRNVLFSSDWEAVPQWNTTKANNGATVFSYKRNLPGVDEKLVDKGLVVVFTKGYSLATMPEKPLNLPFTFFTDGASTTEGFNWYQQTGVGGVDVQLQVPAALESNFNAAKEGIQLRYFVLSPQFLEQHNLTAPQVKSLSYKKFIALLNTNE